ncbi:SIMPL domain-containing protein [Enterovirga sp.]|uniref:SIMPL domain-containing protein n=1 Tax=Enterovirga sp. TaxID=2026350 RepID=UPI002BCEC697|nr:SIMPL domain-containing protein [Enterovirga sp.]HMO29218.1 SIMPL domain-containing protein [Enterovirga sp.]
MKHHLAALAALSFSLLPGFAMAETSGASRPLMTVTGRATLEAAPDFASISIGVTNKAPTTAAAIDATSAAAGKIATSAIAFGIAPRDIQTSYVALQPAYKSVRDPNGNMEPRPDGYVASNSVVVRVRDLAKLGGFLRSVVDGGANQIGGISFELADPGKLERDALAAAVKDARRQAEVIAGAAGVRIERIESINAGGSYRPMPRPAPMSARAARADVPVQPGSLEVSSEIQMTFSFEPAQ